MVVVVKILQESSGLIQQLVDGTPECAFWQVPGDLVLLPDDSTGALVGSSS